MSIKLLISIIWVRVFLYPLYSIFRRKSYCDNCLYRGDVEESVWDEYWGTFRLSYKCYNPKNKVIRHIDESVFSPGDSVSEWDSCESANRKNKCKYFTDRSSLKGNLQDIRE